MSPWVAITVHCKEHRYSCAKCSRHIEIVEKRRRQGGTRNHTTTSIGLARTHAASIHCCVCVVLCKCFASQPWIVAGSMQQMRAMTTACRCWTLGLVAQLLQCPTVSCSVRVLWIVLSLAQQAEPRTNQHLPLMDRSGLLHIGSHATLRGQPLLWTESSLNGSRSGR